jgi:hypothetical protein
MKIGTRKNSKKKAVCLSALTQLLATEHRCEEVSLGRPEALPTVVTCCFRSGGTIQFASTKRTFRNEVIKSRSCEIYTAKATRPLFGSGKKKTRVAPP